MKMRRGVLRKDDDVRGDKMIDEGSSVRGGGIGCCGRLGESKAGLPRGAESKQLTIIGLLA
jgi:hypothetical protein